MFSRFRNLFIVSFCLGAAEQKMLPSDLFEVLDKVFLGIQVNLATILRF